MGLCIGREGVMMISGAKAAMKKTFFFSTLVLLCGAAFSTAAQTAAAERTVEEMGMRILDENGCTLQFVSDGTEIPTILFAVNIYNQEGADNSAIVAAIERAVANGCRLDDTDEQGLTPLNAAILFNEPFLVGLLLEKGANPDGRIIRPGKSTDGMNSYEFIEMLSEKDRGEDRAPLRRLLEEHRQQRHAEKH